MLLLSVWWNVHGRAVLRTDELASGQFAVHIVTWPNSTSCIFVYVFVNSYTVYVSSWAVHLYTPIVYCVRHCTCEQQPPVLMSNLPSTERRERSADADALSAKFIANVRPLDGLILRATEIRQIYGAAAYDTSTDITNVKDPTWCNPSQLHLFTI